MWRVGLFDLLHRRRRFVLAVIATSLAFGLSLLMAGTVAHLGNETNRIVALFHADRFVVADGGTGPFTTTRLLPTSVAKTVAAMPGVKRADAFVSARENVKGKDVNVLGIALDGLGSPEVHTGLPLNDSGEAITDTTLGYDIGQKIKLGEHSYIVIGLSSNTTFYFGQPTVFLTVKDVQDNFLAGQPYATAIAVRGDLRTAPPGTQIMTAAQVRNDLNRPQKSGTQTVVIFNTLLWLMAAGIVATMVYLTALERSRDIAVMKAMGASNRTLFGGMAVQGLALALAACAVGAVVSLALSPIMPFAVETPGVAYAKVLVIGVVVGLVAALVGLRRAVQIDPALAFGAVGVTALTLRDVTIEYSSGGYAVRPINGLDLDVGDGELVILLGASGCGKTKLLSALAALLTPARGSIRLDDTEITQLHGAALAAFRRRTVGVVYQAFNLIPSLNALDNVAMAAWNAGESGRAGRDRARALLESLGLGERLRHRPSGLSGGEQQRVAIARALCLDPPLLLADEPTAHLDEIQVEGVLRLLRQCAAPGRAVVVATHDDRLLPLADRVVELTPRRKAVHAEPERITLPAGSVLFAQGDEGDVAYVIESGEIHLVRDRAGGGEELVARMGPNRYFGELAPLFGMRRTATARAAVDSVVTTFTPHDLRSLMTTTAAAPARDSNGV